MDGLFTFVIPTMWRYEPFVKFLTDLLDHDLVHEVIIINNDKPKTPELPDSPKLRLVDFGGNIYVNPSWNRGVRFNELGHYPSNGFNTQRKWGNVQKKNIVYLSR